MRFLNVLLPNIFDPRIPRDEWLRDGRDEADLAHDLAPVSPVRSPSGGLRLRADEGRVGVGPGGFRAREAGIEIGKTVESQVRVKIRGVDVSHPRSGEIASSSLDGIACWFIGTDRKEQSFFLRQVYFLGVNDPHKALTATPRTEIDEDDWPTLHSDASHPFDKTSTGRIAAKVINCQGDEIVKVFSTRGCR